MIYLHKRSRASRKMQFLAPLLALSLTTLSAALLFLALGHAPLAALYAFFIEPLADWYGFTELLVKMTPLMLCAAGLSLCFRANIWNIGAEGQFIMGALAGGSVALYFAKFDSNWLLPISLLAGILAGMLWAALALLLKLQFAANEILSTIMLNYIAVNIFLYAVHGPLKDPEGMNFAQSAMFNEASSLPSLLGEAYRPSIAFVFGLMALLLLWIVYSRSMAGFALKVLGADASAAAFAGFSKNKLYMMAFCGSGALAGLAGIAEALGNSHQLVPDLAATGFGYTAIIVVFLGRLQPLGILLASALLALSFLGGENLQIAMQMPRSLSAMFQGMLLFYLLGCDVLVNYRLRFKSARAS